MLQVRAVKPLIFDANDMMGIQQHSDSIPTHSLGFLEILWNLVG